MTAGISVVAAAAWPCSRTGSGESRGPGENGASPIKFHGVAFGFKTNHFDEEMQYGELDTGETILAVAAHETGTRITRGDYVRPADGKPAAVELGFLAAGVAAAFEKAVHAGGTPVEAPQVMPWGWTTAYIRGIDGMLICLASPPGGGGESG